MNNDLLIRLQPWQRFLLGGGINSIFSYFIYLSLKLIMNYQWAYLFAYVGGIIFSYTLNTKMVFRVKHSLKTAALYPLVYVVQYTLSALLLHVLVSSVNVNEILAPIIVTIFIVPLTFIMTKFVLNR